MLWIRAEENHYYKDTKDTTKYLIRNNLLPRTYDKDKIEYIPFPTLEDIKRYSTKENIVFLSPKYPSEYGFSDYGYFTLVEIDNNESVFTEEQKGLVDEEKILTAKLGIKVRKSDYTFHDMAGASKLIDDTNKMLTLESFGVSIGGLFLFGVPGIGKSYFAECFAGHTNRYLVELDLSYVINTPNPTRTIDKIFDYLYSQKERFVLWIDEIEKMFDTSGENLKSKQVFGKLLLELNEVSKKDLDNIIYIATANNIAQLMKNNPEFLRKGRFKKLYFLNYPKEKDAIDSIDFYIRRTHLKYMERFKRVLAKIVNKESVPQNEVADEFRNIADDFEIKRWLRKNTDVYPKKFVDICNKYLPTYEAKELYEFIDVNLHSVKNISKRFIYTYSEIKVFIEELYGNYLFLRDKKESLELTIKEMPPLQVSMKEAIQSMVSQAKSFSDTKISQTLFLEI